MWRRASPRPPAQPVGHAAQVPRPRVGALLGLRRGGLRTGRRAGHELHRRAGPDPHEGGPLRHLRQAAAGGLSWRGGGACQHGFLTTHPLENVLLPEDELLRTFVGDPRERLRDWFDPARALMTGVVQNQDSYMKGRIAQRGFTDRLAPVLRRAMAEWTELTGRRYDLVAPYRCDDAEEILVAMGTLADTAIAVVDHLRARGRRAGALALTAFRPFPPRVRGARGRAARRRQSAHARAEGRALRPAGRRRSGPGGPLRLGRPRLARRLGPGPGGRLLPGWPPPRPGA